MKGSKEKEQYDSSIKKTISKIINHPFDFILGYIFSIFLLIILYQRFILGMTEWGSWTGFGSRIIGNEQVVFGKTLWDVLELLLIPVGGAYIAFRFSLSLKNNEQKITDERILAAQDLANDQQRENTLQNYFNQMTGLLLEQENKLRKSKPEDEVRVVARALTITALRMLDGERKALLLHFLKEAKLIEKENPVIILKNADFSKLELRYGDLSNINLDKANFENSKLYGTNLSGSNLINIDFSNSELINVVFDNSNLEKAHFYNASLEGSFFNNVNLKRSVLFGANLWGITINNANLVGADLYKSNWFWVSIHGQNYTNLNLIHAHMQDNKYFDPNIHTPEYLSRLESK